MNDNKYRHELKHFINAGDYISIRNRLKYIMSTDNNADADGRYHIRSLYFDNSYDKVLREKIDGINIREKYRIRFYNGDDSFIKLEKKSKVNGLCLKIDERITREECESLLKGNIDFLKNSSKPLFLELYYKMKGDMLKPKTVVDYTREAYIYRMGNVRVTFDMNIRSGISATNMFDSTLPTINSVDNRTVVLEVKFDEFLPEVIQDIIQTNDRRAESISKYAACRIYG